LPPEATEQGGTGRGSSNPPEPSEPVGKQDATRPVLLFSAESDGNIQGRLYRLVREGAEAELNGYICGGYFVVTVASNSGPVEFCEICKAELPPGDIVTLSTCLTVTLPEAWALEWVKIDDEERKRRARIWAWRIPI
jgi:hypothetical protein